MSGPHIPRRPGGWTPRRADVRMLELPPGYHWESLQAEQPCAMASRGHAANAGTLHPECAALLTGPFQRRPGCGYKAGYIDGTRAGMLKGVLLGVSLTCAVMYVAAWLKVVL